MRNLFIAIIVIGAVLVGTHQVRSMDQSKDKKKSATPENAKNWLSTRCSVSTNWPTCRGSSG